MPVTDEQLRNKFLMVLKRKVRLLRPEPPDGDQGRRDRPLDETQAAYQRALRTLEGRGIDHRQIIIDYVEENAD